MPQCPVDFTSLCSILKSHTLCGTRQICFRALIKTACQNMLNRFISHIDFLHPLPGDRVLGNLIVGEGGQEVVVQGELELPPVPGPEGDHGGQGVGTPVKVEKVWRTGLLCLSTLGIKSREGSFSVSYNSSRLAEGVCCCSVCPPGCWPSHSGPASPVLPPPAGSHRRAD